MFTWFPRLTAAGTSARRGFHQRASLICNKSHLGVYRVLAFNRPQPELEYRNPQAMREYEAKAQVVSLLPSQKQQLQLRMILTTE